MKPGYKDDPKWKEYDKKVRKQNEWIHRKDEEEDLLEKLTNQVV